MVIVTWYFNIRRFFSFLDNIFSIHGTFFFLWNTCTWNNNNFFHLLFSIKQHRQLDGSWNATSDTQFYANFSKKPFLSSNTYSIYNENIKYCLAHHKDNMRFPVKCRCHNWGETIETSYTNCTHSASTSKTWVANIHLSSVSSVGKGCQKWTNNWYRAESNVPYPQTQRTG